MNDYDFDEEVRSMDDVADDIYEEEMPELYTEALGNVTAAVKNRMDILYSDTEKQSDGYVSRFDLVAVNGHCIGAMLDEEYAALSDEKKSVGKNGRRMSAEEYRLARADEMIAEAYLDGREVTYYSVDPSKTKAETVNILRFDAQSLGMDDGDLYAASEYAKTVRDDAGQDAPYRGAAFVQGDELMRSLNTANRYVMMKPTSSVQKKTFFGEWEAENGRSYTSVKSSVAKLGRSGGVSLALAAMLCSEENYAVEDVFDPTKLTAEKAKMGKEVLTRVANNDAEWVADMNMRGRQIMCDYMVSKLAKVDFGKGESILTDDNLTAVAAAMTSADLSQDVAYVKEEKAKWYSRNRGSVPFGKFSREYDNKTSVLAGFYANIANSEQNVIMVQAGLDGKLYGALDAQYARSLIAERRRENPGKADYEFVDRKELTEVSAYMDLQKSDPEFAAEFMSRAESDSRALADEIKSSEFWKHYNLVPATDEKTGAPRIKLTDGVKIESAFKPTVLETIPEDYAEKYDPELNDIAEMAEEEELEDGVYVMQDEIKAFDVRMAQYTPDSDITKEVRLYEARRFNEDMRKAGLKPFTEEELEKFASDPNPIRDFKKTWEVSAKLKDTVDFQTNRQHYEIAESLERAKGYIMDLSGTEEADRKNQALADELVTDAGERKFLRELYTEIQNTAPSEYFAKTLDDKIAFFGDNMQKRQMGYEYHHIFAQAPQDILTDEEKALLKEKVSLFESGSTYEAVINLKASPLSLFVPKLSIEQYVVMKEYYMHAHNDTMVKFMDVSMSAAVDLDTERYCPYIAEELAKAGFLGKDEPGVTYRTFDAKGKPFAGRNGGIHALSAGDTDSVRFEKVRTADDGAETVETLTLDRAAILKLYDYESIAERLDDAYTPQTEVKFSDDPELCAMQKGIVLCHLMHSAKFTYAYGDEAREAAYQSIAADVINGNDLMFNFVSGQKPEVAKEMLTALAGTDKKAFDKAFGFYNPFKLALERTEVVEAPGEKALNAMFAPNPDNKSLRRVFDEQKIPGGKQNPELNEASAEADGIVIPVPKDKNGEALMTDNEVRAVVMSCFFTDEILKKAGRMAYENQRGGSSQPEWDQADAGIGNFFENTLGDDDRMSMHFARLFVPDARKDALALIEGYENGNYEAVAEKAKACFDTMVSCYANYNNPTDLAPLASGRIMSDMFDLLSRPEFADLVSFTEEEREIVNTVRCEQKMAREMEQKGFELTARIGQNAIDSYYLGEKADNKKGYVAGEDEVFDEMLADYSAMRLYFSRAAASRGEYKTCAGVKFGISGEAYVNAMKNRPLARCQKNMAKDPEAYIAYMKEEAAAGNTTDTLAADLGKSWANGLITAGMKAGIAKNGDVFYVNFSEKWRLDARIDELMKQIPPEQADNKLDAIVEGLPYMDEIDLAAELTAEEMERRAQLYEEAAEKIGELDEITVTVPAADEDEDPIERNITDEIINALSKEAELLRRAIPLAESEKGFERSLVEKQAEKQVGISFEEAEVRVAEEKAAVEDAAAEFGDLPFGHPTKATYRDMILELIENADPEITEDPDLEDTLLRLTGAVGLKSEGEVFADVAASLDPIIEKLNEKALDGDDELSAAKFSFVVNLQSRLEAYDEAGELIPDARGEDSVYLRAYEDCGRRGAEIAGFMDNIDRTKSPELWKLAQLAKGSMDNVRTAIAEEAFGNRDRGIDTLRESDDLATLAVFTVLAYSKDNAPLRAVLESRGADTFVHRVETSQLMKEQKALLTMDNFGPVLSDRAGFRTYMIESHAPQNGLRVIGKTEPVREAPEL